MQGARTARKLARRIDLDYVNHPRVEAVSLSRLSVMLPLFALAWLGLLTALGRHDVFSAGPITESHASFSRECHRCHQVPHSVPDSKCAVCHSEAEHTSPQRCWPARPPACASCHREHGRGEFRLSRTADGYCTACHRDLKVSDGKPLVTVRITDFGIDHPEFGVLRRKPDLSRLKSNHEKHLKAGLRGIAKLPWRVRDGRTTGALECVDCHQPDESGRFFKKVRYAERCAYCHDLAYDPRIRADAAPNEADVAPHGSPLAIHRHLIGRFSEYAATHPDEVMRDVEKEMRSAGQGPQTSSPEISPFAGMEWVDRQVESTETTLLLSQRCKLCHEIRVTPVDPERPLPYAYRFQVAPVCVPERFMTRARFDHRAHRSLACEACHEGARSSKRSADLLMPGIAVCRICHERKTRVRADCSLCHTYHNRAVTTRQGSLRLSEVGPGR